MLRTKEDTQMPFYWVDQVQGMKRDQTSLEGKEMNSQKKRLRCDEHEKYALFELSTLPLAIKDNLLVGIVGRKDAENWWYKDPLFFDVLGFDNYDLPILKFREQQTITCNYFKEGIYYLDQTVKCGKYAEFNKIQVLKLRESENSNEECCITVIPHKYPGLNSGMYESQFFTWRMLPADVPWPNDVQFIKKNMDNGFVMAPHGMTAIKLCNLLTNFLGPPFHPHEAVIGKQIYVHCQEDGPNATLLPADELMIKNKDTVYLRAVYIHPHGVTPRFTKLDMRSLPANIREWAQNLFVKSQTIDLSYGTFGFSAAPHPHIFNHLCVTQPGFKSACSCEYYNVLTDCGNPTNECDIPKDAICITFVLESPCRLLHRVSISREFDCSHLR